MKIFPSLMILIFCLSCHKEKECELIQNKEEIRGSYYFYFRPNFYATPQSNSISGGGFNTEYVSGKVSKAIYDDYEIGDEYCF